MAEYKLTRPNSTISDTEESFYRKRSSFSSGFTLTNGKEVLLWSNLTGGDNNYYQWNGSFPKVVAPNSTPNTSGGVSTIAWVSVGDANYITKLNSSVNSLSVRVTTLEQNPTAKSAYGSYLATTTDNPVKTEAEWVASLKGITGSGLNIRGSFNSTDDLPKTNNTPGDAYIIQEQMWVWDSVKWSVVGEQGPDGKSTYQIWLENGNQGTQTDFLLAQKGDTGDAGPDGAKGEKGDNAFALTFKGILTNINQLPTASQDNLSWFYVINLDGYVSDGNSWINIGNLQGPQGEKGDTGDKGEAGKDGVNGKDGADGQDGADGAQGPQGPDGAGLEIIDHFDDETELPTTGNAGDAYLVGTDNELYVWLTGATTYTNVGKIAGKDGADGVNGTNGTNGTNGVGIQSVVVTYQTATSATTAPSGNWSTSVQAANPGEYLWTRVLISLSNSTTYIAYSVAYQGINGTNGTDGTNGTNGKDGADGHSVVAKGYLTDTANLPTSGNNLADMYYVNGDTYIWDGNSWVYMGTNIGPTGPQGPDGADGADGQQGVQGEQGTLWINLSGPPSAVTGRQGDFYIDRDTNNYYQKTSDTQWSQLGTFGGGNVYDAPSDGTPYIRQDAAWVSLPVGEAPNDGAQYARQSKGWAVVAAGITDAASDSKYYARYNGTWTAFTPLDEAPVVSGQSYVRSNGAWRRFNRYDLLVTSVTTTGAVTLDASTCEFFNVDLSTTKTLTISNLPSGRGMTITLLFTGNTGSVSYTNTINWESGTAPTYKSGKTAVLLLWDGTNLLGYKPGGY